MAVDSQRVTNDVQKAEDRRPVSKLYDKSRI